MALILAGGLVQIILEAKEHISGAFEGYSEAHALTYSEAQLCMLAHLAEEDHPGLWR